MVICRYRIHSFFSSTKTGNSSKMHNNLQHIVVCLLTAVNHSIPPTRSSNKVQLSYIHETIKENRTMELE